MKIRGLCTLAIALGVGLTSCGGARQPRRPNDEVTTGMNAADQAAMGGEETADAGVDASSVEIIEE